MPYAPGTINPFQADPQAETAAIISALREQPQAMPQVQAQPQQQAAGGGMDQLAQLLGNGLGQGAGNIGTAMQYGTNPFSQQTNMLAAQDAAFK